MSLREWYIRGSEVSPWPAGIKRREHFMQEFMVYYISARSSSARRIVQILLFGSKVILLNCIRILLHRGNTDSVNIKSINAIIEIFLGRSQKRQDMNFILEPFLSHVVIMWYWFGLSRYTYISKQNEIRIGALINWVSIVYMYELIEAEWRICASVI